MDFNPDEYLKTDSQFDPDAYLSDFNPDEYLSGGSKRKTTLGEDVGISLGNAASTMLRGGGLLAGGLAGTVGADDLQESIYK